MKRRQFLTLAAAASGSLLLPGCAQPPGRDDPPRIAPAGPPTLADALVPPPVAGSDPLASPVDAFAARLNRRLGPQPRNLVWSPWSVAMVLAMVRDGAAGDTKAQLSRVLDAGADFDARLADGWRRMAHAQGTPLRAANAVWAQRGMPWKRPFLDDLAALSASLKDVDFATGDPEGLAALINAWVAGHTGGKIDGLLDPAWLNADTRMVLVNALHFKASWLQALTERPAGPFAAPGGPVQAPYLESGRVLLGRRAGGWTSALIPCEHVEFGLAVALADDPAAAPASAPLEALTGAATGGEGVLLTLPAFRQAFRALLNEPLQAEGATLAFDADRADFSAMTEPERLFLKLIVHEAVVDVNARGIEAAAATAAVMERASGAARPPISLVVNRPFAYALVHLPTRTPLLLGQVADPTRVD